MDRVTDAVYVLFVVSWVGLMVLAACLWFK